MTFVVGTRNAALAQTGSLTYDALEITWRRALNAPGGWIVQMPWTHPARPQLQAVGTGIHITDADGATVFSGPVYPTATGSAAWKREQTSEQDLFTVSGTDDLGVLWWRIGVPLAGQSHAKFTAPLAGAASSLIGQQMQRTPAFGGIWQSETADAAGRAVTLRSRYTPIGADIAAQATAHSCAMSALQSGLTIRFTLKPFVHTGLPVSVAALTAQKMTETYQQAERTTVYALGQGEGAAREVRVADLAPSNPWARIERAVDRRDIEAGQTAELAEAATAGLIIGGRTIAVEFAEGVTLPKIGETVDVSLSDGTIERLPVVESVTTITPKKTTTTVTVGQPAAGPIATLVQSLRTPAAVPYD